MDAMDPPEVSIPRWFVPGSSSFQVSKEKKGKVVDARCRDLTNSAVCTKGRENPGSVELCDWHEVRP